MAADATKKDSDWVKYFCIVFAVLIAVVGFLFFKTVPDDFSLEVEVSFKQHGSHR